MSNEILSFISCICFTISRRKSDIGNFVIFNCSRGERIVWNTLTSKYMQLFFLEDPILVIMGSFGFSIIIEAFGMLSNTPFNYLFRLFKLVNCLFNVFSVASLSSPSSIN